MLNKFVILSILMQIMYYSCFPTLLMEETFSWCFNIKYKIFIENKILIIWNVISLIVYYLLFRI